MFNKVNFMYSITKIFTMRKSLPISPVNILSHTNANDYYKDTGILIINYRRKFKLVYRIFKELGEGCPNKKFWLL